MARRSIALVLLVILVSGCATVDTATDDPMAALRQSVLDRDNNPIIIEAQYILLYYGTQWCPHCLAWSEELNEQYRLLKGHHGDFVELIFVGLPNDLHDRDLRSFLEEGGHEFGYLPIVKRQDTKVMEFIGDRPFYIPGLLLLDQSGEIIASSNGESRDEYVRDWPLHVLQGLLGQDCANCQK